MNIYDVIPQICDNILLKNVDKEVVKKYLCDEAIAVKKYINSEVILSPETEDFFIGIVVCGTVEIFSTSQSHKVLLKTAGAGAMFGVANLYSEEVSFPSKIISKGNTQILLISVEAFKALLENNSIAMKNFLSFMSQKVLYLNKKIASYTVGNNESKVAYFLLDNNVDGVVELNINLSDVAVMLDMGRASLYRALDKFEEESFIERKGKTIRVLDKDKLKKYI